MKKTLIIVGSNSQSSINRMLGEYVINKVVSDADIVDMRSFNIPVFGTTAPSDGVPQAAIELVEKMKDYNSFIIISPEHNGSMPAAFKNLIDWMSLHDKFFLNEKPVLIMGASPGPHGAKTMLSHLEQIIPRFKGFVTGVFSLGEFGNKFDVTEGIIVDAEKDQELKIHLENLNRNMSKAA